VVRYDPLREVAVLPGARTVAGGEACRLASLVGLASGLVDRSWPDLTLVPRHLALAADARRHRSTLVAATALAVSAPLPLLWHDHRSTVRLEAASRAVERQLVPLRKLAARNREQRAQVDALHARIGVAADLIAAKSDWLRFFADLQERLGRMGDVWLDALRPAPQREAGAHSAGRRFLLEGRLLDRGTEGSSADRARDRVRTLLELLADSPGIARVEDSRFVAEAPGILRFTLSVVPREEKLR
jgi:type IV pilus assembly protein PilM